MSGLGRGGALSVRIQRACDRYHVAVASRPVAILRRRIRAICARDYPRILHVDGESCTRRVPDTSNWAAGERLGMIIGPGSRSVPSFDTCDRRRRFPSRRVAHSVASRRVLRLCEVRDDFEVISRWFRDELARVSRIAGEIECVVWERASGRRFRDDPTRC